MLSETIKTIRKANGLTQEELGKKLNVVRQTVSKWESNLSVPDAEMLIRLADALNTTVSTLLDNSTPDDTEEEPSIRAIAARLEILNEELACRSQRNRKIWQTVFSVVGVFALLGLAWEGLQLFHIWQGENTMAASSAIIGGADGPTAILITSGPGLSALLPILAGLVSLIGLYRTRRK